MDKTYDIRQINLTSLLVLDAVCRHKNTVRAAEELAITQPAISMHLNKLRDITGLDLFIRSKAGMEPSSACLELQQKATAIFDMAEDFLSFKDQIFDPSKAEREFRIAVPIQKSRFYFEAITMKLRKNYPGIETNLVYLEESEALAELQLSELDLFIGFLPSHLHKRLNRDHIQTLDFCVVCSNKSEFYKSRKITKAQFLKTPHIKLDMGKNESAIDRELKKLGLLQEKLISVPDQDSAKRLLKDSDYLNIVDRNAAKVICSEHKELKVLATNFALPKIKLYQIWDRKHDSNIAHSWLRNYIRTLNPDYLLS